MEDADHYTADGVWGTSYSGTMYGRRQMMYAIVHDLRTPLSIVIGYNDMAKQCPLNRKLPLHLGIVYQLNFER